MNRFLSIVATAVVGLALVACGPASSSSGEPGKSEAAASQPQASGGGSQPSFTAGAVSELEDFIPDTVGDLTIAKESLRGSEFLVAEDSDPAQIKFVEDLGVSPSDISIATGSANNADFTEFLFAFVIRAQGADSDRLQSAFLTASSSDGSSPLEWVDATVGGKSVQTAAGGAIGTGYLYATGDVLVWLIAAPDALAGEFFSQLP